jgi:hypothetical protein
VGRRRTAWRRERAREFGRRHPCLTLVIICAFLAGLIAVCAFQLRYGAYLGRSWLIAAVAGMASAAVLIAVLIIRRHRPAFLGRFEMAWLGLWVLSTWSIRYPFPLGPYGSVQAFFNVAHAAQLGYEAVTNATIVSLLVYLLIRRRGLPGRAVLRRAPVGAAATARLWHAPDRGGLAARLRFPSARSTTWRAGRVIAANGTVTWLSLNGDAEVDLTSACHALQMQATDTHQRQPRTTTLVTANGIAEVDLSPIALRTLASSLR